MKNLDSALPLQIVKILMDRGDKDVSYNSHQTGICNLYGKVMTSSQSIEHQSYHSSKGVLLYVFVGCW